MVEIYHAEEYTHIQGIRNQFLELASMIEELQLELRRLKSEVEKLQ